MIQVKPNTKPVTVKTMATIDIFLAKAAFPFATLLLASNAKHNAYSPVGKKQHIVNAAQHISTVGLEQSG